MGSFWMTLSATFDMDFNRCSPEGMRRYRANFDGALKSAHRNRILGGIAKYTRPPVLEFELSQVLRPQLPSLVLLMRDA